MLIGSWIATVFISGVSLIFIFSFFVIFLLALGGMLFLMPDKFGYIINRLNTFFDPSKGDSFQSSKALEAIKLGGLKGQGTGEGILKESVPEAHTDYIIAIISEEYGAIVSILIITIFLYIAFRIVKFCSHKKDEILKLSLCGLFIFINFSNFYSCWREYKYSPYNRHDSTFFELWGIFFNWKRYFSRSYIELYKNKIRNR